MKERSNITNTERQELRSDIEALYQGMSQADRERLNKWLWCVHDLYEDVAVHHLISWVEEHERK